MNTNGEKKDDTTQILIKGWETLQSLAKSNAESAWNLRAWGISVWSALVAYAYTSNRVEIIIVAIVMLFSVFLIELAIRQVQYKFIKKSIEIERSINCVLIGDEPSVPENGISTNIDTPTIDDLLELLTVKRWLVWFPYLLLIIFSIIAFIKF